MYTFVSESENFNNETGYSSEAVFQNAEYSSLSLISYGSAQRLGFIISYTTTGSH